MAMKLLICGGYIGESQANRQVREDIVLGWRQVAGRDAVTQAPIAAVSTAVAEFSPDYILCIGSYLPETAYFGEMRAAADRVGARCIFWATEDPYEIDASYRITADFDVIFSCDASTIGFYDHPAVHYLPLAGSEQAHFRPIDPDADKPIDVLFCGVAFNSRKAIVRGSLDFLRSLELRIIGPGWGEFGRGFTDRRIEKDELIDLYCSAKVVLNIGRSLSFENKRYRLVPASPGPRTYEAALAGATQLFHEDTGRLRETFDAEEIATFSSDHELQSTLSELLRDHGRRADLARRAQQAALAGHTYRHRAARMLDILEKAA
jgi:spore maturation protein CgeB